MANTNTLFCTGTLLAHSRTIKQIFFRIHVYDGIPEKNLREAGLVERTCFLKVEENIEWTFDISSRPVFNKIYTREFLVGSTQVGTDALSIRENERFVATLSRLFMKTLVQLLEL